MNWRDHITIEPRVLAGKPIVKGTRLGVAYVVDLLAEGWSVADVLANFPTLSEADIRACLAYASETIDQEAVYPLSA